MALIFTVQNVLIVHQYFVVESKKKEKELQRPAFELPLIETKEQTTKLLCGSFVQFRLLGKENYRSLVL